MFKKLLLLPLLMVTVLFSGCDPETVTEYAAAVQSSLGVNVQVNADNSDTCLLYQLRQLKADYDALTNGSKRLVRERVKVRYKQIVLNSTVLSQVISGEVTLLVYYTRTCGNNQCWNTAVATKALADARKYEGAAPVTKLSKSEVLLVTPQYLRNESLRRDYWTGDVTVYDKSESLTDSAFIAGRQSGAIWLNKENAVPDTSCGAVVGLRDVIDGQGLQDEPRDGS